MTSRQLVTFCSFLLIVVASHGAPAQAVPKLHHEKATLANGLEVILQEDHSTPIMVDERLLRAAGTEHALGRLVVLAR